MANSDKKSPNKNLWSKLGAFLQDDERSSRFNRSFHRAVDAVGEAPLVGRIWKTPGEVLDKSLEGAYFGTRKGGQDTFYDARGVKDLWELAGRPKVKLNRRTSGPVALGGEGPAGYFLPRDWGAMYDRSAGRRVDPISRLKEYFGRDAVYAGKGFGGELDASTILEELSHAVQYEDPERWTNFESRQELFEEKLAEMERKKADPDYDPYKDVSSDEGYTHDIIAPRLYQHLREAGYSGKW
jgi:hypothetical protein|tara:strand:+ start:1330 stop:2049 length:720 start_codon:yes stop_codon:yes gene_type:complete